MISNGRPKFVSHALFLLLAICVTATAFAQLPPLRLPEVSPHASISQTVGLTDITIDYHRPGVNGRTIWGDLVPWDTVWRAGANENTTITFSSPVTINGQKLEAGSYGLHMLPTRSDWSVIFSNQSHAWGSFSYEQKEDALRVTVKPQPADMHERLTYSFDEPSADSVTAAMYWEKLKIPFTIKVDVPATVTANIAEQMRSLPRFGWQGWNQAAAWVVQNGGDLAQADAWADRSLGMARTFANLRTKAAIAEKRGDAVMAKSLRDQAMTIASESDINAYGYSLLGQKKYDEALVVFQRNVKEHPASWNALDSLADAYAQKGDQAKAAENYRKAMSMATDETQKKRIAGELRKLSTRP
ncbi:MAG: DUF2911 domain-containing protein [Acidobacteriota bacterium]